MYILYACMYMYVHVHVYVHRYIHAYTCTCTYMHRYMHVHVCTRMYACTCMYKNVCMYMYLHWCISNPSCVSKSWYAYLTSPAYVTSQPSNLGTTIQSGARAEVHHERPLSNGGPISSFEACKLFQPWPLQNLPTCQKSLLGIQIMLTTDSLE